MTRKDFLRVRTFGLAIPTWCHAAPQPLRASAFSPLKAKLANGNGVLFVNRRQHLLHRNTAPMTNSPKPSVNRPAARWFFYAGRNGSAGGPPVRKRMAPRPRCTPAPPATLSPSHLAALPGAVPREMFRASRRAAALETIPRPDCAILHHGHNMRGLSASLGRRSFHRARPLFQLRPSA